MEGRICIATFPVQPPLSQKILFLLFMHQKTTKVILKNQFIKKRRNIYPSLPFPRHVPIMCYRPRMQPKKTYKNTFRATKTFRAIDIFRIEIHHAVY